jgi:hypothetical protein
MKTVNVPVNSEKRSVPNTIIFTTGIRSGTQDGPSVANGFAAAKGIKK